MGGRTSHSGRAVEITSVTSNAGGHTIDCTWKEILLEGKQYMLNGHGQVYESFLGDKLDNLAAVRAAKRRA